MGENLRSIYAVGAVRAPTNLKLLEHGRATGEHVTVRGIKVAGVPGIGHVAGATADDIARTVALARELLIRGWAYTL